jgi:hypothetical protein
MSEEVIQRFSLSDNAPDLTGSGVFEYHWRQWGSVYVTRIHGYRGVVLSLADNQGLKDKHGFELQPDIAAPANKLSDKMKKTLQAEGINPNPNDVLLNVLRALRDKYESTSPNPYGFDIS